MLKFIFNHPRIQTVLQNWEGYALTKAVAAGFIPLVQFLLEKGASPAHKDGIAVHAAIRRKDLSLVKLLVEPNHTYETVDGTKLRVKSSDDDRPHKSQRAKKRRIEDRVKVDQAMLKTAVACDARDIVQYIVQEKACVPDMKTVRLM